MSAPIKTPETPDIQKRMQLARQNMIQRTLTTTHNLVNKSYLSEMQHYDVLPVDQQQIRKLNLSADVRIFRVERLIQENKQSVLESMTASYTALGAAGYSVFLFLKSDGCETWLFIGTRGEPGKMLGKNSGDLLQESFKGHFPGSFLYPLNGGEAEELLEGLVENDASSTVTAVSSVPSLSTKDQEHFMQGLERFIDAAESRVYQGLILAEPVSMQSLNTVRSGYEQVATQLSSLEKRQFSYGLQDSESVSESISEGLSQSLGESLGLTETKGTGGTTTQSSSSAHSTNEGSSSPDVANRLLGIGAIGLGALAGGPLGALVGGQVSSMLSKTNTEGTSDSTTQGESTAQSNNTSTAHSKTASTTDTKSRTDTQGISQTRGQSQQIGFEVTDKTIQGLLNKIDHHIERIEEAKTYGGWHSAAYFISDSPATSEALASLFLGLTRGSNSATEDFALTTWGAKHSPAVVSWLGQLTHPRLKPALAGNTNIPYLTPATLVSSKETAIQLSLPRRSTSTVVVQEATAFGRKVQRLDEIDPLEMENNIELGCVRHLWSDLPQKVKLNIKHLTGHTFVTGATGSGKSNTIYALLDQLLAKHIPFMVIEPAKGEYKHVFGHRADVRVLGTNNKHTELLRINPFAFPPETHVLEHVDRLIEIFNVCWSMYAAMPALLKEAVLGSYEECGWDLSTSTQATHTTLFPTFADLLVQLEQVIEQSSYSQEVKSNYAGALLTRVRSLVTGLNGQIFSAEDSDNKTLFDSNVVVDLSRVGSQETRSLIMGLLVIRLSEYRAEQSLMNQSLRHVTVLEEAHNILRSHSGGSAEGSHIAEKSVEMLTNAIAEMRTYGEGFIIADQSPSTVHVSAIRNTNTKILMRLPDEADRRLAGKSAALSDDQLDELVRLPKGVAAVYQNDWLEAVLCKVDYFPTGDKSYQYQPEPSSVWDENAFRSQMIQWLLAPRCKERPSISLSTLTTALPKSNLPTRLKIELSGYLQEAEQSPHLLIHEDNNFYLLADQVVNILGSHREIEQAVRSVNSVEQLHPRLQQLITKKMGDLPSEMALTVEQSVMKHLTQKGEDYLQLYAAWRDLATRDVVL